MKILAALLLSLAWLPAAAAPAGGLSKDELKKIIDANPDIILDVLKKNRKALFEVVGQAAQEEQGRRQKEEAEAERREFDESFKNPKKPLIDATTRIRGNKDAKYTLVEYSDFQCSYCARAIPTLEALKKQYGEDLRFIYKNKPLPHIHPQAMPSAQYFEAVALQSPEKAWIFHDKLFANQDKLGVDFYKETAKELGLDLKKLEEDANSQPVKDRIQAEIAEAEKFGIQGTPGFLINGVPIRGAYPLDYFESIFKRLQEQEAAGKGGKRN